MHELIRTNDVALISFALALLRDAGLEPLLFDQNASIVEGSIGALPQRIMIIDDDCAAARRLLAQAGLAAELSGG